MGCCKPGQELSTEWMLAFELLSATEYLSVFCISFCWKPRASPCGEAQAVRWSQDSPDPAFGLKQESATTSPL